MISIQAMPRLITRFVLLLCCSLNWACQRQPSAEAAFVTLPDIRQNQQYDCGLACLQTLYAFYDKRLSETDLSRLEQQAKQQHGLSGQDLCEQLRADQFHAFLFKASTDGDDVKSISQHLSKGRPLIILLANKQQLKHYVILCGREPDGSHYYIHDPAGIRSSLSAKTLHDLWADRFCLLAMPKQSP